MPLPGMGSDLASVYRVDTNADSEGNYDASSLTLIGKWAGFLGLPDNAEQQVAAQRGQVVNAVFATDLNHDIRIGDIVAVGTHSWNVVEVRNNRLAQRAFLRERI